ncbi:hypothetical protein [Candidatus Amarobacter glycogenicus]|uniref:hypothetical protein n=1 Tax=Candidatus Amarobacter glycogenicus TaxID=3140699 RepID=UPI0031374502|nr:hypothetical protein [Dehalococcoidia bacterium]
MKSKRVMTMIAKVLAPEPEVAVCHRRAGAKRNGWNMMRGVMGGAVDAESMQAMFAQMHPNGAMPAGMNAMMGQMWNQDGTVNAEAMQAMHAQMQNGEAMSAMHAQMQNGGAMSAMHAQMHNGEAMPADCTEMMNDPDIRRSRRSTWANPQMMVMTAGPDESLDPQACTPWLLTLV